MLLLLKVLCQSLVLVLKFLKPGTRFTQLRFYIFNAVTKASIFNYGKKTISALSNIM